VKRTEGIPADDCFLGEHEYAVDAQRRVALPSPWRRPEPGRNRFVLLPGRDKSLQLVPAPMFQELLQKLRKVSFADAKASIALATIGAMAQEVVCDRQGRFALSPKLLEYAGIRDKVVLLGAVTAIQIWEPNSWARRRIDSEAGLDALQALQERPDDITEALRRVVKS